MPHISTWNRKVFPLFPSFKIRHSFFITYFPSFLMYGLCILKGAFTATFPPLPQHIGLYWNLPKRGIFLILLPYCLQYICTSKTRLRKFETNIPRKGTARPQSQFLQFLHSCFCERTIYSPHRLQQNRGTDRGNI